MNRRQALKNFGLGAGILIVGPSTLSLLQSCKSEPKTDWEPAFLTVGNGFILKQILDVIIPETDTPGANDLNIAEFIDSYMDQVAPIERRDKFNSSANAFAAAFKSEFDKNPEKGSAEEYEQIVKKYLKATPEQQEIYLKRPTEDQLDIEPAESLDTGAGVYSYLSEVRGMAIWAWKTSEEIGENVLWYDPVPGQYIACGPVSELGKGKAMSL
ncbi:gluconate 2-dehydrogenase subunit 3 family protein [Gillisia sp. Q332]|uniref:gluconate 2-dehydrogenase subunit 3 family protein n=1 Tax=Gillisia xinjiangensis TaxID=3384765 RepID=UPI00391A7D17